MTETIVVAGALAQKPGHGGHTWVLLQYLLGFRQLGCDVLFLDRISRQALVDRRGAPCALERSWNLAYLLDVMQRFGLQDAFSLDCEGDCVGLSRARVLERVDRAAMLLNVNGFLVDQEILSRSRRRVFLDIDPGFIQMWREIGLADLLDGHDLYVTIAENIHDDDCTIPTCGLNWLTTRQPVVLAYWPESAEAGDAFTSVGAWRGPYGPIEYRGQTYGLRVHQFRRFITLPSLTGLAFEVALIIHQTDGQDLQLLNENGWSIVDPRDVAADPCAYQRYLARSRAEFMIAKDMYVRSRSGWISDRSICYLASGKPVLAQDTGLHGLYPQGEGFLTFSTLDDAVAGVDAIASAPARHSRAARTFAEEYFDSDKVLARLLELTL